MKKQRTKQPPRWAQNLLELYCRPELLEDLQGDLNEYFDRNVETRGFGVARVIYIVDVLKFFRGYTARKPTSLHFITNWIMIQSYIKTSRRSLLRNKLFSSINVAGLAISMSVGLLMIAFIADLLSYDQFHQNRDRIYRVITEHQSMNLASTSVKAGKEIKETISGIESLTILRNGFGGDAQTENKILPLNGLYADASFFKVFSFPLLYGDPETALKEPYSLVLTEHSARRIFGKIEVVGKPLTIDTLEYIVRGVLQDIPKHSHLRFESLASFSTAEILDRDTDGGLTSWKSIFMNYVYMVLPPNGSTNAMQSNLDALCEKENAAFETPPIHLSLQPLTNIVLGTKLVNQLGPVMNSLAIVILSCLALIIILSACFNYTNLSIARSMRRSREVGIRKVVGAQKRQVLSQFITESVIIASLALILSFGLFLLLRQQFISLHPFLENLTSLTLTPQILVYFITFALFIGVTAGILPALFYSRINATQALKDVSSLQLFRHVNFRKSLVVIQYVFSLIFITTTIVGYQQYKSFLTFDLGFTTENILNIRLQGNKSELLIKELKEVPEVTGISQSLMVMSLGSIYGAQMKYQSLDDSAGVWQNIVDDKYLPLHEHAIVAGKNFTPMTAYAVESEAIVNEQLLKKFSIGGGDPTKAIGEEIIIDGLKLTIVGVVQDFHYETVEDNIEPMVFRCMNNTTNGYVNVKISSNDWPATFSVLETAWRKIDQVHKLEAKFYDDQIAQAYSPFSMMLKVVGFLAFLALCISSMGLFGMVVFTTETRLKEMSIRKVLGASEGNLILILSKGFLLLLGIAALIAIPSTYFLFEKVILTNFAFHEPVGIVELMAGAAAVVTIGFLMLGSQTISIARSNPAVVLKNE